MNKKDLKKVLRYLKLKKTFREYLLFKMMLETDIKTKDLMEMAAGEIIGKSVYKDDQGKEHTIPEELKEEIYEYCEFLEGDMPLFAGKSGKPIIRSQIWTMLNRSFEELGYEKALSSVKELRDIYKGE